MIQQRRIEGAKAGTSSSKSRKFLSGFRKAKSPTEDVALCSKFQDLPYDILLQVLAHLPENYIVILCLLSRSMFDLLLSSLYASLDLKSSGACRATLKRLDLEPNLAIHIRKLVVRPSRPSRWIRANETTVDESLVADMLAQLASSGHLENLHTFIWDGMESPNDSLWLALRLNCPHLKTVGTSVGLNTQKLDPESHLFDFRDLIGFSLVTQKLVRWTNIFTGQLLPDRLWEMLLVNSPNLVELTLDGTCIVSQLWNIRKILSGRWRSLRALSFGNLSSRSLETDSQEVTNFLKAHPRLENLMFFRSLSGFTSGISSLPLVPLPRLRAFTGKVNQLKGVTGAQLSSLRTLHLSDYFSPAANFAPILQEFPSVLSLSVCVNFLDTTNGVHQGFFERLLGACPQLMHVSVSSTSSFNLDHFSEAIRHTPHLRSFVLTLPRRKITQQSTSKFAMRTAGRYPSLEEFIIRVIADWDHEDQLNDNYRLSHLGVYYIIISASSRLLRIHESLGGLVRYANSVTRVIPPNSRERREWR
ncbi:hypothetical protein FB451DRAFT_1278980 [Mycena latifolia]|nr:hypothetical protein FB451DRAFT_1278980 [Mycena latifolia]